jgi:hypothetical protein
MRRAWSLESGISFEMDLDRENYDFISSIIDPEVVMTALRKVYQDIDDPKEEFKNSEEVSKEDRAAAAFSLLHQQVQRERESQDNQTSEQPSTESPEEFNIT